MRIALFKAIAILGIATAVVNAQCVVCAMQLCESPASTETQAPHRAGHCHKHPAPSESQHHHTPDCPHQKQMISSAAVTPASAAKPIVQELAWISSSLDAYVAAAGPIITLATEDRPPDSSPPLLTTVLRV